MKFPLTFQKMLRAPATKAAFISVIASPNPSDCDNCGGAGSMHIFIATEGPFRDPPGPGRTGHFGRGERAEGWWRGETFGDTCPVCNGVGHVDTGKLIAPPADFISKQGELVDRFENVRKPYAEGD